MSRSPEQIVGNRVLRFTPKHTIAFDVELEGEVRIVSSRNVLCYVLQDDIANEFADEFVISKAISLKLLRLIDNIVIDHSGPHFELRLHDLNIARYLD